MNWYTHPESDSLNSKDQVILFNYFDDAPPFPAVDDILTIEYPSYERTKGVIKSVSSEEIEVEINYQLSIWKLIETEINNGKITLNYVVS